MSPMFNFLTIPLFRHQLDICKARHGFVYLSQVSVVPNKIKYRVKKKKNNKSILNTLKIIKYSNFACVIVFGNHIE